MSTGKEQLIITVIIILQSISRCHSMHSYCLCFRKGQTFCQLENRKTAHSLAVLWKKNNLEILFSCRAIFRKCRDTAPSRFIEDIAQIVIPCTMTIKGLLILIQILLLKNKQTGFIYVTATWVELSVFILFMTVMFFLVVWVGALCC